LTRVDAQAHWIKMVFSQGAPFLIRVERRLLLAPAEKSPKVPVENSPVVPV
jgi:hypothetical protein